MVRAQKKELLSQSELNNLKEQIKENEDLIRAAEEGVGQGTKASIDVNKLKMENRRLQEAIDEGTAKSPRAAEKDKLMKEERELEDALQVGMPTRYEMDRPTKNPGAVRKHLNWSKANALNIERYRELQRILRPMEPKSVENLRKDR